MGKAWSLIKKSYLYVLIIPILLFLLGVASNQAVLIANWGKFPVMLNDAQIAEMQAAPADDVSDYSVVRLDKHELNAKGQFIDPVHSIMGHNSKLKALADIWDLGNAIYSIGDFGLILGLFLFQFAPIVWGTLVIRKIFVQE